MPQFFLKIKAELENLKSITPTEGNLWKFDIQPTGGGEVRNGITVSSADVLQLEGSRGDANFIIKWPHSRDQAYMKILTNHRGVKPCYSAEDSGKFVTILGLECRNIEPIAWSPQIDFVVESSEGTIFQEVDLTDRDWADYDEEHDLSVSITNLEYKIETSP